MNPAVEARVTARYGPGPGPAIAYYRRAAAMPKTTRYALVRKPYEAGHRPLVFTDLPSLARRIHRERAGDALQMSDAPLLLQGQDHARQGVLIHAEAHGRRRLIGWAFLNGADRQALQNALFAEQPQAAVEPELEGVG